MIPNSNIHEVTLMESNITGETIDMTIDATSLDHIMSVLTDLYSDTIGAVVREYSTNAWDSHVLSGKADRPIEVFTPNALSPFFKVVDHGAGMGIEDLRNTYSKYGSSTKRKSNDYNGTLGFGSKSALTYTSSFTVIAVKDGICNVVSVGRHESGAGFMDIVDTTETDAENGVTIQIPVPERDHNRFNERVKSFFLYWDKNQVRVNGKEPNHEARDAWMKSSADGLTFLAPTGGYGHDDNDDIIVMGGVAYPSPFERAFRSHRYIHFTHNGSVAFSPSRESLLTINKNMEVHKAAVAAVTNRIHESMRKTVEEATTFEEAIRSSEKAVQVVREVLYGGRWGGNGAGTVGLDPWAYKWRGKPLSVYRDSASHWAKKAGFDAGTVFDVFAFNVPYLGSTFRGIVALTQSTQYLRDRSEDMINHYFKSAIILEGVDYDTMNSNRRATIIRGLRALGHDSGTLVFAVKDSTGAEKVFGRKPKVVTNEEVRKAAREAAAAARVSNPPRKRASKKNAEGEVITRVGSRTLDTEIKQIDQTGKDVIYLTRGMIRSSGEGIPGHSLSGRHDTVRRMIEFCDDQTFVVVTPSEEKSFRKAFPDARSIAEARADLSTSSFVNAVMDAAKADGYNAEQGDILSVIQQMEETDYYRPETSDIRIVRSIVVSYPEHPVLAVFVKRADEIKIVKKAYDEVQGKYRDMFVQENMIDYLKTLGIKPGVSAHEMAKKVLSRYPMLVANQSLSVSEKHIRMYMDAVDADSAP